MPYKILKWSLGYRILDSNNGIVPSKFSALVVFILIEDMDGVVGMVQDVLLSSVSQVLLIIIYS